MVSRTPLHGLRISGARIQKRPLTHPQTVLSRFGTVSVATDWQGLDAPFIVELFTFRVFQRIPGGGQPPAGRCCHRPAPDASVRYPNLSSFSPDWSRGRVTVVLSPAGGFRGDRKRPPRHPLRIERLRRFARRSVSRSPAFAGPPAVEDELKPPMDTDSHGSAAETGAVRFPIRVHRCSSVVLLLSLPAGHHEIESGDWSWLVARDYFQKPLSNVAGHSRGTTLYGTRTRRLVKSVPFPGW